MIIWSLKSVCCFLFLFSSLGAPDASAGHREMDSVLGAVHMNPAYQFTEEPVLEEGVAFVRNMGAGAVKLWFGPSYTNNYPLSHSWPAVTHLVELAETEYFQNVFQHPDFSVYALELITWDWRGQNGWKDGDFSSAEEALVYNEVYDLTAYLLTNYNASGKTFILQNWEGDNALGENASNDVVNAMADWLNTRQDAITAARNDLASVVSDVWVYGCAECNKVGQPVWDGPRLVTDVFPQLQMDLYSYSDWYTRFDEAALLEDIHTIKRLAPDSETFGYENVMLGEFGMRLRAAGETGQVDVAMTEFETGLDAGARFLFYWCAYSTELSNKVFGLVLNDVVASNEVEHLVADMPADGKYHCLAYDYFKTVGLTLDVYDDPAEDFSRCSAGSNIDVVSNRLEHLDNDPGRFRRQDSSTGELQYEFSKAVRRFAITVYEYAGADPIQVWASETGAPASYSNLGLRKVENDIDLEENWTRVLYKNSSVLTNEYRFFKIKLTGDVTWNPQVSALRFYYDRPAARRIQFGGEMNAIDNLHYQSQVGADEVIAWWGTDTEGHTAAETGSLKNGTVGSTLCAPDSGLTLTTRSVSSVNTVRTNTVTAGLSLGIHAADASVANTKFSAPDETSWKFDFDQDVTLEQICFYGFIYAGDEVDVAIAGGGTYTFNAAAVPTAAWSDDQNYRVYTFENPVELPAGTDVTLSASSGEWTCAGLVVETAAP